MDNPQYLSGFSDNTSRDGSFKPYYKWITLNTRLFPIKIKIKDSFKPYYKWITLNT